MPVALTYAWVVAPAVVLALLLISSLHRAHLLWVHSRRRRRREATVWTGELPVVTIQLPIYNELHVSRRLIDAACQVDYPRDRLEVQVLDDSTDATAAVVAERARQWRARGVRIEHVRRPSRHGFKAGALAHGLARAGGEFLVVLDADFVASPDLIRRLLPAFRDPQVGMVQARWDHLNERENWLTRGQALLLDGHFLLEQDGRYRAGLFFNFNGTAGMWRRRCLEDAGGWRADTLTEDLDLSYRAQMKGWRFVLLPDYGVSGELPADVSALEVQQRRWSQGAVQTARKLLPALLRGPWSWPIKLEAVIHLCGHLAYPLTLLLGLLLYPSAVARRALGWEDFWWLDLAVFASATMPIAVFYYTAGRLRGHGWNVLAPRIGVALVTGIGLTAPVSRAVLRGLWGRRDPFVRTPKRGALRSSSSPYFERSDGWDTALKLALGATMTGYALAALANGLYGSVPFALLFAAGYLSLGVGGLTRAPSPSPHANDRFRGDPGSASSGVGHAAVSRGGERIVREQDEEWHPDRESSP